MKLLIIGGTRFVGRHLVDDALQRGYDVTLFNRGQSNPDLFPQVQTLVGDRDGGLDVLAGRSWDVVIDTCGYVPRIVRAAAEFLAPAVQRYIFISTISVYADFGEVGLTEESALATMEDETVEEVNGETYGPLKVLCEQAVQEVYSGRALIIRPGLIVGPHDLSDRFTYWPVRVAQGGEVLVPGAPDRPVQFIDVRDLGSWTLDLAAAGTTGVYHATGPDYRLEMGSLLNTCKQVSGSNGGKNAEFTWVSDEFLVEQEVGAYVEMPLWVPAQEDTAGFERVNVRKAIAAGLIFRPLADTVRDTLAWATTRPDEYQWRGGLRPEKEAMLLETWHRNHIGD